MSPSNITVNCDETKDDCIIQWQRPQISHSNKDKCFKYEINIKYKVRRISSSTFNINTYVCVYRKTRIKRKPVSLVWCSLPHAQHDIPVWLCLSGAVLCHTDPFFDACFPVWDIAGETLNDCACVGLRGEAWLTKI